MTPLARPACCDDATAGQWSRHQLRSSGIEFLRSVAIDVELVLLLLRKISEREAQPVGLGLLLWRGATAVRLVRGRPFLQLGDGHHDVALGAPSPDG
jgi:hypothetical protein